MTRKKRILLIVCSLLAAAVVLTLILINAARPTISDYMKLTSPDQIVKIELGKCGNPYLSAFPYGPAYETLDITNTEIGKRYKKALFSLPVSECKREPFILCGIFEPKTIPSYVALIVTVENTGEDYPFYETSYVLPIDPLYHMREEDMPAGEGLPTKEDMPAYTCVKLNYTIEARKAMSKLSETRKEYEEYTLTLPKSELFTPEFVERQLEQ